MNVILSADLGDSIAGFYSVRYKCQELSTKATIYLPTRPGVKAYDQPRFDAIKPLLMTSPYVEDVIRGEPPEGTKVEMDFTNFRSEWIGSQNLIEIQARYLKLNPELIDFSPCFTVSGHIPQHNQVVICRSARNWGAGLAYWKFWNRSDVIFLGISDDWEHFKQYANPWPRGDARYNTSIQWVQTPDLLEACRIILGAKVFLVNQTAQFWAACAVGARNIIQERSSPDSTLGCLGGRVRYSDKPGDLSLQEIDSWFPSTPNQSIGDKMRAIMGK